MVCSLKDHRFRSSPSTSKVEFQQPQPFFALLSPAPESAAAFAASVCMCDAGDFLGVDRSLPASSGAVYLQRGEAGCVQSSHDFLRVNMAVDLAQISINYVIQAEQGKS